MSSQKGLSPLAAWVGRPPDEAPTFNHRSDFGRKEAGHTVKSAPPPPVSGGRGTLRNASGER